jgi:hypothetical protein
MLPSTCYEGTQGTDIVSFFNKFYIEKEEANNVFLLGDFNIEDKESDTYAAATSSAFLVPDAILKNELGSNVSQDKIYDQILYYNKYNDITFSKAGIFNYYDTIFDDYKKYASRIKKHNEDITEDNFDTFKTYQMSDHLPLWVEMNTDHTESYLEGLKKKGD